jgi:hypothetical protein
LSLFIFSFNFFNMHEQFNTVCDRCMKSYSTPSALRKHLRRVHKVELPNVKPGPAAATNSRIKSRNRALKYYADHRELIIERTRYHRCTKKAIEIAGEKSIDEVKDDISDTLSIITAAISEHEEAPVKRWPYMVRVYERAGRRSSDIPADYGCSADRFEKLHPATRRAASKRADTFVLKNGRLVARLAALFAALNLLESMEEVDETGEKEELEVGNDDEDNDGDTREELSYTSTAGNIGWEGRVNF